MAFTASEMQVALVKLETMFADPNAARTELLRGEAATARALLPRQTAKADPILKGNKCVGATAWYFRPSAADVLSQVDGLSGCALPTASQGQTLSKEFETTVLAASSAALLDNRCDNLQNFQDELARQVQHIMSENRRKLNRTTIIGGLTAAAQDNIDTFINAAWDDSLPRIIAPTADFSYDNLNEFRIVAENNGMGEFFFVSGRLFNDDKWMAMLNAMNETQRNQMLAWNQREIYFDTRDLDQTMTKKTAFAIDVNSYLFWNTFRSTPTVTLTDTALQIYTWVIADPILTWNDGGVTRPVMHEFEMKKVCSDRDAQAFMQSTYTLWGRIIGGFETVPEGPNGETGIMEFGDEAI